MTMAVERRTLSVTASPAKKPAKQNGDDGIDVSMSGNERGRVVFEEPVYRL